LSASRYTWNLAKVALFWGIAGAAIVLPGVDELLVWTTGMVAGLTLVLALLEGTGPPGRRSCPPGGLCSRAQAEASWRGPSLPARPRTSRDGINPYGAGRRE
jgi:hypothetical protein